MSSILLIDESGTIPDTHDSHIILAGIVIYSLGDAERFLKKYRPRTLKNERMREIKFYNLGARSKQRFFKYLKELNCDIFLFIIDKNGRSVSDTPENMAGLSAGLISSVLSSYTIDQIILDRHFNRSVDLKRFNRLLVDIIETEIPVLHKDSQAFPILSIADMVAGATLAKIRGNTNYYQCFQKKIVKVTMTTWIEIKTGMYVKKIA